MKFSIKNWTLQVKIFEKTSVWFELGETVLL